MTKKMHPEVKARWVAALRSGKYKQGSGVLRDDMNQFCCLGVLCDITGDHWNSPEDGAAHSYKLGEESDFELPPKALAPLVGLDWEEERVWINGNYRPLHDHNDNGRTFAEIADAIEEQL